MQPSSITRLKAESDEIILRWSVNPFAPSLELPVEIVDGDNSEPVIRTPLKIGEETPVTLVAKNYMVNGIVRFCRPDKNSYLITVSTQDVPDEGFGAAYFRDPGTLVVDDFLTEEEEAKILESLQDSPRSALGHSPIATTVRALLPSPQSLGASWISLLRTARQLLCPSPAI